MKRCAGWPISVCTWSMSNDFCRLDVLMKETGIDHVHLDLRPVCTNPSKNYIDEVCRRGWAFSAAMIGFEQEDYSTLETIRATGGIVPDACWPQNKAYFLKAIETAARLGIGFLSAHIGFIDHASIGSYKTLLDRMTLLADAAAQKNVMLLMETGQETAEELRQFLNDLNHPAVGINIDPANMILYGKGDPVEAVGILAHWIRHVHIKDAIASQIPGQWGTEVVWGTGQVGAEMFLSALQEIGYRGAVAVEREAGQTRHDDIRVAIERLIHFR
ncbi:MAG TPA: sugar phosphate isomerase/epimerase family protein [Anaerohalosphaeraceae bacterium]|nr:sugar phosphate isomerase/epimerase family protein [Anaerohalosphaeraceae bacterium]HPC65222.1 sugar phosphate isomerase/epimerase family protein [Anaerohalosphaeraceae bacterium]HRS72832.1 sugar phosphate isomerase/epimerase family protein [Anaerohalosphaeraceae bacterium]HRV21177.1 sugar phosphate isomerase/epimerase family protein [Anaerohalosphaeraceae bacterium]